MVLEPEQSGRSRRCPGFPQLPKRPSKADWNIDFQNPNGQITAHKGSDYVFMDNMNAGLYYQTIIHLKEMQQEGVADAAALDNAIKQSGHVAVYGIHFNTGKADILPDSESTLNEIVKLMEQDATLKLYIEGHTDNQGSASANQALSEKRAQSVVSLCRRCSQRRQ